MDFNGKRILVTGGAGFIGSNIALTIEREFREAEVVVFDRFRDGSRFDNGNLTSLGHFKNLIGFRGEVIAGDINNPHDLSSLSDYRFDYIFHQAAISDTTVGDQKLTIATNVGAFKEIVRMAVQMGAVVVYASSASVYGKLPPPHRVGVEAPANIYGFSKLAMDNLAMKEARRLGIPIVGLRYFNVYGPREFYKGKTASMVLQFGLQLLKGERAKLFEGSDRIKRDFIYVDDVVQANLLAATSGESGVFNVGTGRARSFQEIVDILKELLGIEREDEYIPNPYTKQYQFFTEADIEETRERLGYEPRYSLEEGIRADLDYIQQIYEEEIQ
ncbi:MAG: ADP-glyceromanno-heptose 6-epimerase [Epsilonproteobacteria bacterium]|nr:ADP-glyceromanno-heptose 6-epimerase [Campylobacterota bacterium]NPA56438.1 ADP-glyceromanno-heptose 6-epimerase [Campylobacterota bacterium]